MQKFFLVLVFFIFGCQDKKVVEQPKVQTIEECMKTGKGCAEIDIEAPDAKSAYKKGCITGDFYACYRLGQYFEFQQIDLEQAIGYYANACKGNDKYGCEAEIALQSKLCFEKNLKKYCENLDPKGEYRMWAYMKSFDPKYADCFLEHDWSSRFQLEEVQTLFYKLRDEKNPKLLETLEASRKGSKYDGESAEVLNSHIRVMHGGEFDED